jgi:hypothetical protein
MGIAGPLSRRAAVKALGAAVAAGCCLAGTARAQDYKPQEQKKLTKEAAHYQTQPKGDQVCAGCPYFIQPGSCVVVEGEISPAGWCPMYTTFSPMDRGAHS